MKAALVGVIGHVDHGKTALVKALTGIDTDRLAEEKARGLSIVPGFAVLRIGSAEIDLIDLPGHERFIRAMISGATGINAVLLVVAANEGIKPQTREHLEIARLIGVERGVVAVTKCDLVSAETSSGIAREVDGLVRGLGFSASSVATSAMAGSGLAELASELGALAEDRSSKADDGFFYLPIDRAFVRPGIGPVVTGTLRRGALAVGDEVELAPIGLRARIRGLQAHGRDLLRAPPGRRAAAALRGVEVADLHRGLALTTPGALAPNRTIDVSLRAISSGPRKIVNGQCARLLFGASDVGARIRLLDCDEIAPGGAGFAQLRCDEPVALPAREPFILRLDSPSQTLGGGVVLDPVASRRRRFDAAVIERLHALSARDPLRAIRSELALADMRGILRARLAQLVALGPNRLAPWLDRADARPRGGELVVSAEAWKRMRGRVLAALEAFHRKEPLEPGLRKDALAALLPETPPSIREALLAELVHTRELMNEGGFVRLTGFRPCADDAAGAALTSEIESMFRKAGLAPPDEKAAVRNHAQRDQALRYLVRSGALVRTRDRVQNRTIVFHRDAVEQAKRLLRERFPTGESFTAGQAGAALGTTRKFTIPLLEYLDATSFTVRRGDRRVVAHSQMVAGKPAETGNNERNRSELETSSLRR